jgi:hypothetical protein
VSWAIVAVALVAFALALVPTRRLFLAGWRPAPLAVYLGLLVTLGVTAVFVRAGIRVVVPALLVLYVLPFIGAPEVVARTVARVGGGRRPRIVEGRATAVPDRPDPPGSGTREGSGEDGDSSGQVPGDDRAREGAAGGPGGPRDTP